MKSKMAWGLSVLVSFFVCLGQSEPNIQLHMGGKERKQGWTVVDIQPAPFVDIVSDVRNLSMFPPNSVTLLYASHVLEHFRYQYAFNKTTNNFTNYLGMKSSKFYMNGTVFSSMEECCLLVFPTSRRCRACFFSQT
jgi:hypothetical protein